MDQQPIAQAPPATAATDPVTVAFTSKLMQNFRVAAGVKSGTDLIAITDRNGQVELFAVGIDGQIWNYRRDQTSDTGYSVAPTGLQGRAVTAGVDRWGRIVVFAAQEDMNIHYVTETSSGWSAPATSSVPVTDRDTGIARIFAKSIAGHLFVVVLSIDVAGNAPPYKISWGDWSADSPPSALTSIDKSFNVRSTRCVLTGNSASTAAFTSFDNGIIRKLYLQTQTSTNVTMTNPITVSDADATLDSAQRDFVLAIASDGGAYSTAIDDGGGSWQQVAAPNAYTRVRVAADGSRAVHGLLLSSNNRVFHLQPAASGYLEVAPIVGKAAQMTVATDGDGYVHLFTAAGQSVTVRHLYLQQASGDWSDHELQVQGDQVSWYSSYTSDLTLRDAAGAPLVNTPIEIRASEAAQLTINGSAWFVDRLRPARVVTNAIGMVSVAQPAGKAFVPALLITVPSLMAAGDAVKVQPYGDVQARLAVITGNDLMAQAGMSGWPTFTQADADSVASAVNECMQIVAPHVEPSLSRRYLDARRTTRGLHHVTDGGAALELIDARAVLASGHGHWQLSFTPEGASFRRLSASAAALLADERTRLAQANGAPQWLADFGDLVQGVAENIASVTDVVVNTVVDGVKATITFIEDGATYVWNGIVTTVEHAFDLAAMAFAKIEVTFGDVFNWLGFVFDWNHILLTRQALRYTVNQFITFLGDAAGGIQRIVDSGISTVQSQVHGWFQSAIDAIGQQTIGGYEKSSSGGAPELGDALANNILFNSLVDNAAQATSQSNTDWTVLSSPFSDFMTQLTSFVNNAEAGAAFKKAVTYFNNLGGSPDQIFQQVLSGLLSLGEGVVQLTLAGVQAVVDALLKLAQALLQTLQSVLNESWNVPILSNVYQSITGGGTLTTLDLVSLIAAVPVTVLYKVVRGTAPFNTNADVNTFKASFSAATMLTASGLGAETDDLRARGSKRAPAADDTSWTGLVPKETALFITIGGAASAYFFAGPLSGLLDVSAIVPSAPVNTLTAFALVAEVAVQAGSFPWFISSGGLDCTTADGRGRIMWAYQNIGVLLDVVFAATRNRMPENTDDVGVSVVFLYGYMHLALAAGASIGADVLTAANNILPCIPEVSKLLGLQFIRTASSNGSLVALAVIDGVSGLAIPVTYYLAGKQAIGPI